MSKKTVKWGIASTSKKRTHACANLECDSYKLVKEINFDKNTIVLPDEISDILSNMEYIEMIPRGFHMIVNKRCLYDVRTVLFSFKLYHEDLLNFMDYIIEFTTEEENKKKGLHYSFFYRNDCRIDWGIEEDRAYLLKINLMTDELNFHLNHSQANCRFLARYMNLYQNISDSCDPLKKDLKRLKKIYKDLKAKMKKDGIWMDYEEEQMVHDLLIEKAKRREELKNNKE